MQIKTTTLKILLPSIFLLLLISCTYTDPTQGIAIDTVTVEYLDNPLGIDNPAPRISWVMSSKGRNKKQSAYQIQVANSEKALETESALLWDSGKLISDQNSQIRYAGTPLKSGQSCYFKNQGLGRKRSGIELERDRFLDDGTTERTRLEG